MEEFFGILFEELFKALLIYPGALLRWLLFCRKKIELNTYIIDIEKNIVISLILIALIIVSVNL